MSNMTGGSFSVIYHRYRQRGLFSEWASNIIAKSDTSFAEWAYVQNVTHFPKSVAFAEWASKVIRLGQPWLINFFIRATKRVEAYCRRPSEYKHGQREIITIANKNTPQLRIPLYPIWKFGLRF